MRTNARVMRGDAKTMLKTIPSQSIQCIVTSPPYFWLRDYGCEGQIGREPSVGAYLGRLADTFDEAKRTLKKDGTCFIVIGDTYYSAKGKKHSEDPKNSRRNIGLRAVDESGGLGLGLPRKSAIGIPWRLAIELNARGWVWRSTIMWRRIDAIPETAPDRPTRQLEPILMLAKEPIYLYDNEAEGARDDLWSLRTARRGRTGTPAAPFPAALANRCITIASREGDTVLDPFAGEGTTLRAAIECGRNAIGIDINALCCAYAEQQIRRATAQAER